mgnify:CR=1 FL=1
MTELDTPLLPEAPQPVRKSRRRRRSRVSRQTRRLLQRVFNRRTLFVVFIVTLTIVIGGLVVITDSVNRVQTSTNSVDRVIRSLTNRPFTEWTLADFDRLRLSVSDFASTLQTARQRTGFLRPLAPTEDLAATFDVLDVAQEIAMAADDILAGAQPTLFFLVTGEEDATGAQISSGVRVIDLLRIGLPRFLSASAHLDAASAALSNINTGTLSSERLLQIETLRQYHSLLADINAVLTDGPEALTTALGVIEEQRYLILSQNSDELRPSGGYISTYGLIRVRNGRIDNYSYNATTATSPNPPAPALAAEMNIPQWWIQYSQPIYAAWDGSWEADFPKTAEMARWYYDSGNNPQSPVNGVFAVDLVGFEYMLSALGNVSVPGYDQTVNAGNFRQTIYDIRSSGEDNSPHKRFLAALYQQIFRQWQALSRDAETGRALFSVMLRALQEKHIMLYFTDPRLNRLAERLRWDGGQAPARDHDYFMAVETNLGNKSNRSVVRRTTLDVRIQPDGSFVNRATLTYDYPASVAENDPAVNPEFHGPLDYRNLLQVFVPAGSALLDTVNFPIVPTQVLDSNHTRLVTRFGIPYNTSDRFQLDYSSPLRVETFGAFSRYRLLIQKQAGTLGETVDLQISLPPGAEIISVTPQTIATYDLDRPILEFRLRLTTDQWVEIIYK